jgi:hypothetical protein
VTWARPGEPGAIRTLESDPEAKAGVAPTPARETARARERSILCAACGHAVTAERERISVLEAHEHRFMNPAGLLFHIGCFARAEGCLVIGSPSDDYPWFPGFTWQIALCGACGDHLGWRFQSGEGASFFGLCLDRLRVGDAPPT